MDSLPPLLTSPYVSKNPGSNKRKKKGKEKGSFRIALSPFPGLEL